MCFLRFLYVKFSRKKQRSLKLSEQITNKTAFLCAIKTFKRKKGACLTFCAFYAFYERIKRLSESRLFKFCAFCTYKKHLSNSYLFFISYITTVSQDYIF